MFERGKISRALGPGDAAAFPHELRWDDLVAQLAATRDLREQAGRRDSHSGRFASLSAEHGGIATSAAVPAQGSVVAEGQRQDRGREQGRERDQADWRPPRPDSPPARKAGARGAQHLGRTSASPPTQSREQNAP